jgi:hypothetical protein
MICMLIYYLIYVERGRKEGHMIDRGVPDMWKINSMNIFVFIWSFLTFFTHNHFKYLLSSGM